MDIGVMFWADRDNLTELRAMGFRAGQLGVSGGMDLSAEVAAEWRNALAREPFELLTVVAAYSGEDYADIPAVERTVGFVPAATRAEREARTLAVSDFAAELGAPGIACHVGFVPEDETHPDYAAVRDLVRRICDHAAGHGQTFALETGQEPAHVLLRFLKDVDRENLGINFDPANLILYGTGDPIEALGVLGKHVISVHAKDGDWPAAGVAGALGKERPLGQGAVGMERFVAALRGIGYGGVLNIERETDDQASRMADIAMGLGLLKGMIA